MMTGQFLFKLLDMVAEDVDHNLFEALLFFIRTPPMEGII